MTWTIHINNLSPLPKEAPHKKKMALIGQAISVETMFETGGHIHVYSPGAGADNPLGSNVFH